MKVIAIKPAFYNGARVRVGAELEVPDTLKGSWFAKADTAAATKPAKVSKAKDEPKALSELPKGSGKTFVEAHAGESLA